jgi:diguanylate cyclase (GGDEF)-like protein/PAS domain S-box-containing protein
VLTALLVLLLSVSLLAARRVQQRRTQRAETDLRTIFETAPIGNLVLDADDRIVVANPALARIVGCDARVLADRPLDVLVEAADVPLLRIALAELRHGVTARLETEIRLRDVTSGALVPASIHAAVLERAGGGAKRVLLQVLDVTERKRVEASLQHMADHDSLTGLLNRRRFEQELERHLGNMRRYGAEGAAIVLDVDHFKPINDTFGHGAGDELIVRVARILQGRLRATDAIARLGGDEFAILLPKADRAGAEAVARSLVETVRTQMACPETRPDRPITISLGVVMLEEHAAPSSAAIVAAADLAMYEAKSAGRDGYAFFGGDTSGVRAASAPTLAA